MAPQTTIVKLQFEVLFHQNFEMTSRYNVPKLHKSKQKKKNSRKLRLEILTVRAVRPIFCLFRVIMVEFLPLEKLVFGKNM